MVSSSRTGGPGDFPTTLVCFADIFFICANNVFPLDSRNAALRCATCPGLGKTDPGMTMLRRVKTRPMT